MENIDYEEEQQIISENGKQQNKVKRFKQYLVDTQVIHHFVKFLFGLRTKQQHDESVPNQDALEMFRQYFGALQPDTTEQDDLKSQINTVKTQNQKLRSEVEDTKRLIQAKRQKLQKAREQKRLREQQEAKNPKKGGKK